jgi:PAS domain S-box-containing protein
LTSSEIGYLAFTDDEERILRMYSWSGRVMQQCTIENKQFEYDVARTGLWGEAVRQRKPIVTNDYAAPNEYKRGYPEGHIPIVRHMNIPVFDGERIVAVAGVGNKKTPYVESDINQLTLLMQAMWRIIQRNRADEALRQSEDRFRRLFQQAPIPLMIVDSDDRLQHVNDRFTEYYGFALDDIPTLDAFWPVAYPDPAHRETVRTAWDKSYRQAQARGETAEPLVFDITCKNGGVRTVEISAIFLGELLLTSWVDLTEQKRIQEEINQRKQFLELVLNQLPDAIVTLDLDHRVVDWNPGAEKIFGYTPGEVIGRNLDDLIARDDMFTEAGRKTRQVLGGKRVEPFETVRYRKDGTKLNVIAAGSPILRNDTLTGVVAVYTDISEQRKIQDERKEYEARIQQMQKMEAIGTLAGGIAHDFNNILSGVIGYAELSLAETRKNTPMHRNLQQILIGGRRAGDLVRQILTFSRQSERELKPLQIGPMLKEALKLLRSSLPATIEISKYVSPEVDNVMADPTQIHQIIMNLCTNAAQAMEPAGGRLRVELSQVVLEERDVVMQPGIEPGLFAKITVQDTGKGIKPEYLDKIYNPYFTTKKTSEGTGLGLAVVHGIVQSYKGFIDVESIPGRGTCFDVFIPTIEAQPLAEEVEEVDLPTGEERILVVDDEEVLVDVIREMLIFLGYHVTISNSSNEALVKFNETPNDFDLVLTDMTMPDMTGIQLANRLRKIRPEIPIVLCTGYSHLLTNSRPEDLGLQAIVMKPIETVDLARTVRQVLDLHYHSVKNMA